jgi:hypothetical protein
MDCDGLNNEGLTPIIQVPNVARDGIQRAFREANG